MVRIKLSGGDPISERDFRGFGVVPEGAFGYQLKGTLLLLEFSTKRDWKKTRRLTRKIIAYRKHLSKIRQAYGLIPFVVFIADVERELVARLAEELSASAQEEDQFYFTDYETFKKVEMGQARNAEIYYFVDGKEYSLC